MREHAPFQPSDLGELDVRLLSQAEAVVPMRDVFDRLASGRVIALRHDVDDNRGSLDAALNIAHWEAERGYRSTFFILHGSSYWQEERHKLRKVLTEMEALGHEIGIHNNAIAEAVKTGNRPSDILYGAISLLRRWGLSIRGTVAHGDRLCRELSFVNDEMFLGCQRPDWGTPNRVIQGRYGSVLLQPEPLALFGLEYESNWLPRGDYLSDSGGAWSVPFGEAVLRFQLNGQLHMLWHPDWWTEAFPVEVAA